MMASEVRMINITIQLPNGMLLLRREQIGTFLTKYALTIEKRVPFGGTALDTANDAFLNHFGINTSSYSDDFANIRQFIPWCLPDGIVCYLYVMQLKSTFMFKADKNELYRTVLWSELSDEIMTSSIYKSADTDALHTDMAIQIARVLSSKNIVV